MATNDVALDYVKSINGRCPRGLVVSLFKHALCSNSRDFLCNKIMTK